MPARRRSPGALTVAGSKSPARFREVLPASGELGAPPPHFDAVHRSIWHELCGQVPMKLYKADRLSLEMLTAYVALLRTGELLSANASHLRLLANSFGLNPLARLSFSPEKEETSNAFLKLMEQNP